MVPASLPELGALLAGKYRVERVLGRGGMGVVYAAQHELLCQRVAVKLLLSEMATSPEGLQRFINEARAAAHLDSEHVARVMDIGTLENGLPFMVLEYLEGADLGQLLVAQGQLPVEDVVDYILQACEALSQAHAAGIIHRDIKPSNLYLARRPDGTARVKVLDFGISKVSDHSLTPKALTSTRAMLGTPYYMSPEQFVSPKNVDSRTDVWQLGISLHELLAGAPPFGGETLGELMFSVLNQPLAPLSEKRLDVPPGLQQAIQRCLERDIARRFPTVADLGAAIAPFGTGAQTHLVERMARTLGTRPGAQFATTPGAGKTLQVDSANGGFAAPVSQQPGVPGGMRWTPGAGASPAISSGGGPVIDTGKSWGHASAGGPSPPPRSKAALLVVGGLVGFAVLGGVLVFGGWERSHPAVASPSSTATVSVNAPAPTVAATPPAALPPPPIAPADSAAGTVTLAPPVDLVPVGAAPDAGARPHRAWVQPPPRPPVAVVPPPAPVPRPPPNPPAARPADQLPDNSRQ